MNEEFLRTMTIPVEQRRALSPEEEDGDEEEQGVGQEGKL